jgi:hypothetical protein
MRLYSEKAFTERKEAGQKGDGVGYNVMQLRPGESKEIQEKRMRRKRKSPINMR